MNRTLQVSFTILIFVSCSLWAQSPTPPLQKGISVQMARTSHAQTVPEADEPFAWVITITAKGGVYFRTDPVSPTGLLDKMTTTPRDRQAKLYIKADAGAPFSVLRSVVAEGQKVNFMGAVLLTSEPEPITPGTIAPPKGLEVEADANQDSSSVVVQLLRSPRMAARIKVNNQDVPLGVLDRTLDQIVGKSPQKTVLVRADGQLRFGQVVDVIDICRGAGAKVVLALAEM